jgi:hypothetical protein
MHRMFVIVAGAWALASFGPGGIAFPKLVRADPNVFASPPVEAAATTKAPITSRAQNSVAEEPQNADEEGASAEHRSAEEQAGPVRAAPKQRVDPFSAEVLHSSSNEGSG